jgi:hypothetical protein
MNSRAFSLRWTVAISVVCVLAVLWFAVAKFGSAAASGTAPVQSKTTTTQTQVQQTQQQAPAPAPAPSMSTGQS